MYMERTAEGLGDRARIHAALGEPHRLAIVDALALSDRAPAELARRLGIGTNLLAHHLAVLEDAGLVRRSRSQGDGRRTYVSLRPDRLEEALGSPRLRARRVLFVCTRNAARSPVAVALWRSRSRIPAESAGPRPAPQVDPAAVTVAREHGIDVTSHRPRTYAEVTEAPDLVVSVCDRAAEAPIPFEGPRIHWSVPDPALDGRSGAYEAALRDLEGRVARLAPLVEAA